MDKYSSELDAVFAALSDPTRRAVVAKLGRGDATVSELAVGFDLALPSFMKHLRALEACGLTRSTKVGRVRTCSLRRERLKLVNRWLDEQRRSWEAHTDRLESFVTSTKKARS